MASCIQHRYAYMQVVVIPETTFASTQAYRLSGEITPKTNLTLSLSQEFDGRAGEP